MERKCNSRRNRIHPFSSSQARVTFTTRSYFFIECTTLFFLSMRSPSSSPLTPLLSFSDAQGLRSRLPRSPYLQKPSYATHAHSHTHTVHASLRKNIYPSNPPLHSIPKIPAHFKWRLQCHNVFSAAEIICKFPLQSPDLVRNPVLPENTHWSAAASSEFLPVPRK